MYINGQWVDARSGKTRAIINPYNQEVIAKVPEGDRSDTQTAIQAARIAFDEGPWPHTPASERGKMVYRVAELIEQNKEELARLETLDTGKTIIESEADMDDIASVFRYYAGLADKDGGETIDPPSSDAESRVVREPVGVCGMITPWNYPLLQASWKIAPALAAGCTFVLKPSEITPLTTLKIAEIMEQVGFPAGVVNVVTGPGAEVGAELAESDQVDLISFTGGIETGRKIMTAASGNMKKIALELGGKNPNIVFADGDFETTLDYALNAVYFHAGQVCSAGARLIIEESIHDRFVSELVKRVEKIKLGNGFDEGTQMGPLTSAEHRAKVENYIEVGQAEGAKLLIGGKRPAGEQFANGFFVEPTVFDGCSSKMRIVQEETFGPILTIETFTTEEEAIGLANDSVYGLAGAVWTQDMNRAARVSRALRMGTVWINDYHPYFPQAPWGGYKQSGIGRELGKTGLEEYTEQKHIYKNLNPKPMGWFV
ncbi:betaine-aldehyde dehydrogenase [Hazenella sp. IB182357]|uniref:Betaine-aldehyde dehydrogenase n=1 Tax=Polycladospora coralii TaxID=2771432 RepID=A0A926N8P9_9BACL|nr:betaine-aldehyde dehydrogenase [Polycladospora coralii]MBD1371857.1 betaine-aldehyde dehydrogenase [Polycladospora coralii]MBS7529318.1 betaine-aldehyde dehydrogenase [Polycladospora coralii]